MSNGFHRGQPVRARRTPAEKKVPGWYLAPIGNDTHSVALDGGGIAEIKDENIETVRQDMIVTGRFAVFIAAGGQINMVPFFGDRPTLDSFKDFAGRQLAAIIDLTPYGIRFAPGEGLLPEKYNRPPVG